MGSKITMRRKQAMYLALIKIEWSRWKREFITEAIVIAAVPLLLLTGYQLVKSFFIELVSSIYGLPEAFYAFLGLPPQRASANFLFYILFAAMSINLYLAKTKCRQAVQAIWWDERNGSIHAWINQFVNRKQLSLFKYIWLAVTFCLEYFLWHVIMLLTIVIGSVNAEQRLIGLEAMTKSFFLGGLVILMLISASYLYAVKKAATDYAELSLANWLTLIPLLVGNLYKIRDLTGWLGTYFNENTSLTIPAEEIVSALGWLNELRWLSPLSWLNPFIAESGGVFWIRAVISVVLAGLLTFFAQLLYQKRNLA